MYPTSDKFQASIRQPHRMVAYVDLLLATGETVTAKVTSGSVTIDRTAEVRRSGSVTIVATAMASTLIDRLRRISPYTTRVQVYRGIRYGDGVEEIVPLGRFWIDEVSWGKDDSVLTLHLSDQTVVVQAATMPFRRNVKGDSTLSIISALLAETYSQAWNQLQPTDNLILGPLVGDEALAAIDIEGDRWAVASSLALGLGCDLWADYASSKWRLTLIPDLDDAQIVFTINGGERGVLIDFDRSVSREGVFNSVVARSESASTVASVYAIAEDTDPNSPTYVGTYGRSVTEVNDNSLSTTDKCQRAADGVLANSLGLASNLDLTTVPNPALDVGDAVEVVYPDGFRETHIIDTLEIPLDPSTAMTAKTRSTTRRL